jgi:Protein of unknown function (DUF4089)
MQSLLILGPEALSGMSSAASRDLDGFVAASARIINLPIDAAYGAGVAESFRQLAMAAELVMSFVLADDIDPATVFRP